jgi:hypothetical protein
MRTCRKCSKPFPMTIKIDGKRRNIAGRKFCLECSPFGSHNTKPDDPSRPSSRKSNPYMSWSDEKKFDYIKRYYHRGIERKKKLVEMKGGGCKTCGYNKCLRCLTFHHRDRETKSFSLTAREIGGMSWESVLAEIEKCDLMCLNCHMELEDQLEPSKYSDKIDPAGFEPATCPL